MGYAKIRKFDEAIASGKRSVELGPNNAFAHDIYGNTLILAGRYDEGIVYLKQAIRLNPFPPYFYYTHLGRCYYFKGQYEDALAEYKKANQRAPNAESPYFGLAIAYIKLGREEEARSSASKALEIFPYFSITLISKVWPSKSQDGLKDILDAMRKAGFPE